MTLFDELAEQMRYSVRARHAQENAARMASIAAKYRTELLRGDYDGVHYSHYVGRLQETETEAVEHYKTARDLMDKIASDGDLILWDDGTTSHDA